MVKIYYQFTKNHKRKGHEYTFLEQKNTTIPHGNADM